MSYINDALRKAQKERDNRYGKFGGIVTAGPGGTDRIRKRRFFLFAAVLVVLAAAALLPAVRDLRNDSSVGKIPPAAVSGVPASPAAAVKPDRAGAEAAGQGVPASASVAVQPETKDLKTPGAGKGTVPSGTVRTAPQGGSAAPVAAAPGSGGAPVAGESQTLYKEALLAQRKGDLPRAEALYQKVLSFDTGHVRALNNLGVIYMAQKKREKAVEFLGRAVKLKKDYVDPYYNLACLYAQAGELRESLRYLKIAATIDGNVIEWVKKDADMKSVAASPEFKKIMEGQKN